MAKNKQPDKEPIVPGSITPPPGAENPENANQVSPSPAETNKPAEETENLKDIEGKVVELGYGATIWRSSNNHIDLNAFTGKVSAVIPKGLPDFDLMEINRGVKCGRLKISDEEKDITPARLVGTDDRMHSINIFLDEKKLTVFEQKVKKTTSLSFLASCLATEEDERNRDSYKKIITDRIKILS